ncbi:TIGR04282 family arsenosugar biosynthesis glycosyltransferase [Actinoplanes sp. URMC 104]|uniref:TIGR04282 family arsenosugar biosynthesis glycosyltransferase n=1 Tax=Actinoplanes sp. URMC 104 TaxID=3423409 RepID=UPI003F1CE7DB
MMRPALVVVLCRPPDSPASKTRLVADVGADHARAVYRACLRRVIGAAAGVDADVRLAVAGPPLALAEFCPDSPDVELVRQYGATFAERQRNEIRRGLQQGYRRVAFMASDLPTVEPGHIAWAVRGEPDEVRIVPSHDGGYCIFGSGVDVPELTQVAMSRSDTLTRLTTELARRGRPVALAEFIVPNVNTGTDLRFVATTAGAPDRRANER